ncbi:methyltransferase [Nocardia mexicana]|uniref:Hydroxyneurosporene-O-methyltransferase n=1 Tax=Nocardia mexicana TaxID=279262 RepID=A0A370HCW7_9NOCA|nr:methyltransferase [Nocardia mexicana]RDI54341.1 hydroxyneurosporene-O-methyltransferase [Nocardia mexicana]
MAFGLPFPPPIPVVRAVEALRDTLGRAYRRLAPGPATLMELLAAGWLTQAIHAAAALGIADALAGGPRTRADLARAVGADEDALARLLRLLTSYGIFTRRRDGRYALTPAARALCRDAPVSLRDAALFFGSETHRAHWSRLADAVRTGTPATGTASFFEFARADREFGALFDRAMTSIGSLTAEPVAATYDFARFGTLVDIGGGQGAMLAEILSRAPRSRGILFDLPEVLADAAAGLTEAGVADRVSLRAGSFFDAVPPGGDAYLLRHVLHDWPDERAMQILRTVRTAMSGDARLLIVELLLPRDGGPHPGKFVDLEMLVHSGGRERTETEYRNLLAAAGFEVGRVVPTICPESVIEARPN